jgi:pimeloyl-ACP methyl ester carboxylesterase
LAKLFHDPFRLLACQKIFGSRNFSGQILSESFGKASDPAVLLIMGATASMVSWEDDFCWQLAGGGRYVIRYDNRDTGRSVTHPPGQPQYNLDDMVRDAIGVLDAYGIGSAHVAGASLGGMIAQLAAIEYPERVLSLTLLMSSPYGPEDPDLPPMSEKVLAHFQTGSSIDWSDQAAVLQFGVATMQVLTGSGHSFDEQRARSLVEREAKRRSTFRAA